jgi:hypothetical protein
VGRHHLGDEFVHGDGFWMQDEGAGVDGGEVSAGDARQGLAAP